MDTTPNQPTEDEIMQATMADATTNDVAFSIAASMAMTRKTRKDSRQDVPICEQAFQAIAHLDQLRFRLNFVAHTYRQSAGQVSSQDLGMDLSQTLISEMTRLGVLLSDMLDDGVAADWQGNDPEPKKTRLIMHKGGRA